MDGDANGDEDTNNMGDNWHRYQDTIHDRIDLLWHSWNEPKRKWQVDKGIFFKISKVSPNYEQ